MPEPASFALSVVGAFNNAIQCFEYVYLAKNFDQDSKNSQLKLDIAKLKLSRWGHSVGLNDVDETTISALPLDIASSPEECEKAKQLLDNISTLFEKAESKSGGPSPKATTTTANDPPSAELDPSATSLHKRLSKLSLQNFTRIRVIKRTRWALFTERHARKLVEDITEQINGLVELFPAAQPVQKRLCQEEGRALAADKNVSLLEPLLAKQDPELGAAIKQSSQDAPQAVTISFERSTNHGLQQGQNFGTQTNNFGAKP